MKNFKEEIEAMKAQIAALENNLTCGCDGCECENQSTCQDIGCGDQVILTRGGVTEEPYVKTISGGYMNVGTAIVFTKEELIDFATRLITRTFEACKSAVNNIELDPEYLCELSLNSHNQIEIEVDNSAIVGAVESEIDDVIDIDNDSVEAEVNIIIDDMLYEKQS